MIDKENPMIRIFALRDTAGSYAYLASYITTELIINNIIDFYKIET